MNKLTTLYNTLKKYLIPYFPVFRIILLAIAAFTIYRLCFMFFNRAGIPADTHNTVFLYFRAMTLGLNFDLVIILYLITPFFIFLFIKEQLNSASKKGFAFFRWFMIIAFTLCFLICAADIPFFKQFGNHLTKMFFVWTESPGFVLHLIFSNIEYWGYLLLFILLTVFFYIGSKKLFNLSYRLTENRTQKGRILTFLVLAGLTFVGIRGRTAFKSPIRVGTAFFCEYAFFNQLGLNPCFVFFDSLKEHSKERGFLTENYSDADLKAAVQNISPNFPHPVSGNFEREYTFDSLPKNYNVMIVLMESMSISKMGYYGNTHLTSRFDSLVAQGVFFNHFYSAGIHTFNGLFSTETGFPAIMDTHPLNTYMEKPFKGISYWLKQNGYSRYFFTSHDPQFDNMEPFFLSNDFEQIYSQYDFPMDKASGPLGLPDHFLLESALQKMDERVKENHKPFFSYIMTSSDHGPWEIPTDIPFKPTVGNIQDRATQYADWAIGNFIQKAKQYSWFNNTLFVFAADHGGNIGNTYSMPLAYNHIPCLFYMPSQLKPDTITSSGGQIDLLPTVLSFLKIPFKTNSMGIDLMHEKRPYMYFTADSKIGCIDDNYYYMHLLDDQQELLYQYKNLNMHSFYEEQKPKADSMKNYAYQMIKAAHYILKNKLY
ncbi:MAG: sulfatase [Bacteroidetes bacterium]|nr:sulfatase [Bacteroidota bacterium]